MTDEQGFRGRLDPTELESERLALSMVRAMLESGHDRAGGITVPDWAPLDQVLDELAVLGYDALERVVMDLGQMAFEFGFELHGEDRFGDVLTAREVDRAGRATRADGEQTGAGKDATVRPA